MRTIPEDVRMDLRRYEDDADKGDVEAMLKVARLYSRYRIGDKALWYSEKAASLENAEALQVQADVYFYGRGVPQDVKKGLHYYKKAADGGSLKAMRELAWIYLNGLFGVTKDFEKVRQYYEKGAAGGDKDALHNLSKYYQGRRVPGAKVDEARALELLEMGAKQNHTYSMYEVGRCYRDGEGTSRNPDKAKEWFLKASARGNSESLFAWAMMMVDEALTKTEQKTLEDIIKSRFYEVRDVHNSWFQWYSSKKVKAAERNGDNDVPMFSDLDVADATFLLARLLTSTLDQDNLGLANKLICHIHHHDRHDLLAWLHVLVEDLRRENEVFLEDKLSHDVTFDVKEEVQLIALISQGPFGNTYLAWFSPRLYILAPPRYVAVKVIDMKLAHEDRFLARRVVREQFICRVLKEKEVKHTVKYLGYTDFLEHQKRGLVFELCANMTDVDTELALGQGRQVVSLDRLIQLDFLPDWTTKVRSSLCSCVVGCENSKVGALQVVTMLREAAEALLEVHKIGFIHRNVEARNILCDGEGNIQLAEFGWANFIGSTHKEASTLAHYGKACFIDNNHFALAWWAPECFGSEEEGIDAVFSWNSDVYAFGMTMWQCFAHEDPFSHVKDPEHIKQMIVEGRRPPLRKKPDEGGVLDGNTPDDLIALIDSCWKDNARDRPTLAHVIEELRRIGTKLQNHSLPTAGVTSYKGDFHESWHDVGSIYRPMKGAKQNPVMPSTGQLYVGTYDEALLIQKLGKLRCERKTTEMIHTHIKNVLKEDPYDVYIVHAGNQKCILVNMMYELFQQGGLRCFFDCKMELGADPGLSKRFALTTCRYAVVVLSHEFLTKPHPASELMYAFMRMQWICNQDHLEGWNSLIVILSNFTVEDYKKRQQANEIELPDLLCSDVTLLEWSDFAKNGLYATCLELKAEIIKKDKGNELNRWLQFLDQYSSSIPNDFPLADRLLTSH